MELTMQPRNPWMYRFAGIAAVVLGYLAFTLTEGAPASVRNGLVLLMIGILVVGAFKGLALKNAYGYMVGTGLGLMALAAVITIGPDLASGKPLRLAPTDTSGALSLIGAILLFVGELVGAWQRRKTKP
jgi:hypothetical protein